MLKFTHFTLIGVIAVVFSLISACGYKGPLYLAKSPPRQQPQTNKYAPSAPLSKNQTTPLAGESAIIRGVESSATPTPANKYSPATG